MRRIKYWIAGYIFFSIKTSIMLLSALFFCASGYGLANDSSSHSNQCLGSSIAEIYQQVNHIYPETRLYDVRLEGEICSMRLFPTPDSVEMLPTVTTDYRLYKDFPEFRGELLRTGTYTWERTMTATYCYGLTDPDLSRASGDAQAQIKQLYDLSASLYLNRPSSQLVDIPGLLDKFNLLMNYPGNDKYSIKKLPGKDSLQNAMSELGFMLLTSNIQNGHYFIPDNLLVAEMYYLIQNILSVVDTGKAKVKVLEVGAGNGVLADAFKKISTIQSQCQRAQRLDDEILIPDYVATDSFDNDFVMLQREHLDRIDVAKVVDRKTAQQAFDSHFDASVIVMLNTVDDVFNEVYNHALIHDKPVILLHNTPLPSKEYRLAVAAQQDVKWPYLHFFQVPIYFPSFPDGNEFLHLVYINKRKTSQDIIDEHEEIITAALLEIRKIDQRMRGAVSAKDGSSHKTARRYRSQSEDL